jgi:DNA-binding beta-propeller fold protein YncE
MKHSTRRSALLGLACISLSMSITGMAPAHAWDRARAELFAVLPDGATGPEGIAVAPDGKVYVATFGFNARAKFQAPASSTSTMTTAGCCGSSA